MKILRRNGLAAFITLLSLTSCSIKNADMPVSSGTGTNPVLPKPKQSTIPTVNIAKAIGWKAGEMPKPQYGLKVQAFAKGLDHPRWLYVLPNGDVLVAETNAQPKPTNSIRGFIMNRVMAKAGAKAPSADRISLLRDANKDGIAELKTTFIENLTSPFGMALIGNKFYVANTDSVVVFPYKTGQQKITVKGKLLTTLPAGKRNHHWTKGMVASADGRQLYVAVGSNSDHSENSIDAEKNRAAILKIDVASGKTSLFGSGLRNPVGMDFEPTSGTLWTVVNERDELGGDLVPDYLTSVKEGDFYGWPYSYFGTNLDPRVQPQRPDLVAKAIVPDYALGAHTASLGLTFATGQKLGEQFKNGAFIGQHGSWNRKPRSGYRVIFVPWTNAKPVTPPLVVLDGFIDKDDNAQGRPVGVQIDKTGALLVADDVGNIIWRVSRE